MTDRTPDLLDLLAHSAPHLLPERPKGLRLGWRSTHPDLRSRNDFQWSWPGQWTEAPDDGRDLSKNHPTAPCPSTDLGGLCIAKTWQGAKSGGITSAVALIVAYRAADVLGEDDIKIRVRKSLTLAVVDVAKLARSADLSLADLRLADLRSADLRSANLRSANLRSADLSSADLSSANLRSANLRLANLRLANLSSADLRSADLRSADLSSADRRFAPRGDRYTLLPPGWRVDESGLVVPS